MDETLNKPMISVMIPVYNRFDLLDEALQSVMNQYMENQMEVWVVDDCSIEDGVDEVVKKYPKGLVKYFRQPQNVGQLKNLNKCIELANGKLIHLLHGDDRVLPGFYVAILKAYKQNPESGAFFTRNNFIKNDGSFIRESKSLQENSGYVENWFEKIATFQQIQTPSMVVKKDVYLKVGTFNEKLTWTEDWEMWVRISKEYKVYYINQILAEYRVANNSNSANSYVTGRFIVDLRKVIDEISLHHQSLKIKRKSVFLHSEFIFSIILKLKREKKIDTKGMLKLMNKYYKNKFSIISPFIYLFKTTLILIKRNLLNFLIKRRLIIIKIILNFKNISAVNNILIFSDPRGGSTWLLEMLMNIPKTAVIWEPFQVNLGVIPASFNFGWLPYVPEDVVRTDIKTLFTDLFKGKLQNEWTTRMSAIKDYLKAKMFILKFVRLNSTLPWITNNFKFNHKPIYLLRHPVAVALSQIKAFHQDEKFDRFEIPIVTYNEKFLKHAEFLSTLRTQFEKYIAEWCFHNAETIKHSRAGKDWIVVYYENLLIEPEKELNRIFSELKIEIPLEVLSKIRKPSKMVYKNDFITESDGQLNKWKNRITEQDLQNGERILKYFEIDNYSCYKNMPLKD